MTKAAHKRARAGDVFRIPLPDGRLAIGKVLFVSEYFRDVMLLGVSPEARESQPDFDTADFSAGLFYSSVVCPAANEWAHLASVSITESEIDLSRRIVAGDVWLADNHIGPASATDTKSLLKMSVLGCALLKKKVVDFVDRACSKK